MNTCHNCQKMIHGKPWISLDNPSQSEDQTSIHYCGFICHKSHASLYPTRTWDEILNKEDFNQPRPILEKTEKPMFNYLSYEELQELSEDQIDLYYDLVGAQSYLNNFRYEVIQEIEAEDKRVREIEEGYDYSSDDTYEI